MTADRTRLLLLHAVFLVSGFTAVIYQLIWQRVLLTLYGANTETVTVVVTAFMLGLGVGSLLGGELSRTSRSPLRVFAALELGVGVCGIVSLPVFEWVNGWTVELPPVAGGFVVFLLLLVPTAFMGATLPILIAHTARHAASVGRAVGSLYAINALGSALGAGAAIVVIFGALGQQGSIFLAAALNLAVAVSAAGLARTPADDRVAA
jgi:predicted membrane-bound spermidine synthase